MKTTKTKRSDQKLGVALVGLGRYAGGQLAPALQQTKHCRLAAVVSGSPGKREKWQQQYGLNTDSLYGYGDFADIAQNKSVDIVYVVLPNAMHAEYVIKAARAGKHVICEKPMATTLDDCRPMIDACKKAGVHLGIGYRLHYDPYNLKMMLMAEEQSFGRVTQVYADDSMLFEKPEWRLDAKLAGGGPLMNNGIYCIQAAIYVMHDLPISVTARFLKDETGMAKTVEAGIEWELEFPDSRLATCVSTYNHEGDILRAEGTNGWFKLEPAYEYKGLHGETSEGEFDYPTISQQAAQMDDFALTVRKNIPSIVPGEMGMRDVEIIMAIYESAIENRRVLLSLDAYRGHAMTV
ncbi:Gfo/Idh/MocA family oxidoreductase [Chryseolinea sp. T2]|uniref:Gfo/Idh/MocA family protein n=1 Tax=Chryseolinea sp. T2 TaxID=3129255 RepID=UPI003077F8EA